MAGIPLSAAYCAVVMGEIMERGSKGAMLKRVKAERQAGFSAFLGHGGGAVGDKWPMGLPPAGQEPTGPWPADRDDPQVAGFIRGYMDAIVFTECGDGGELRDAEFSEDFTARCERDCLIFIGRYPTLLVEAYKTASYTPDMAGTDFWFTRNRHGAGYWDRGLSYAGTALTNAAHAMGCVEPYAGKDGLIHAD